MQRTVKLTKLWGLMALAVAAALLFSLVVEAAVSLRSFEAESADDGQSVTISWATGTEQDAAEFYIHRSDPNDPIPSGDSIDIDDDSIITINGTNDKFTLALGDAATGASYSVVDENVEEGETYRYLLVELDLANVYNVYPGFASIVTAEEEEDTGVGIGGGDPTATPETEPTATPEPEVTEEATEEPTAEATEVPAEDEPTATPEPAEEGTPEVTDTPDSDEDETPEPTATPDEDSAASAEPTETPQPTATAEPTATPLVQPTATQTPPPTNTPAPTATLVATTAASEEVPPTATPEPIEETTSGQERTDNGEAERDDAVVEVSAETADGLLAAPVAEAGEEEAYPVEQASTQAQDNETQQETELLTAPAETTGSAPDVDAGYPANDGEQNEQSSLLLDANPDNAPQIGSTDGVLGDSGSTTIGGSSGDSSGLAPPLQIDSEDDGGSTPLLWLVFAAGILVFIAGVAGSILIFTRQREDSA